jgi:hypothetical protein
VLQLHLPVWACRVAANILGRVMANPPLTIDNIVGLTQLQDCDNGPATRDFGYKPRSLTEGLRDAVKG